MAMAARLLLCLVLLATATALGPTVVSAGRRDEIVDRLELAVVLPVVAPEQAVAPGPRADALLGRDRARRKPIPVGSAAAS